VRPPRPAGDADPGARVPVSDVRLLRAAALGADEAVAAIAGRQRGLVDAEQLAAAGLGRGAVARRVRAGRLHRWHPRVYLVGHEARAPLAAEQAALLAVGDDGLLGERTATALLGLLAPPDEVHVVVAGRGSAPRAGVRVHRLRALAPEDCWVAEGLPVTSPARSLLDVAPAVPRRTLERALDEALARGLLVEADLDALPARCPGHRGLRPLGRLLRERAGPTLTRSEAEELLLAIVREAGLPRPVLNSRVCGFEVDALWRRERLVVEVDGFAFHGGRAAFERDRRRDAVLQAAGHAVVREAGLPRPRVAVAVRIGAVLAGRAA
jgi:hypothetical protein